MFNTVLEIIILFVLPVLLIFFKAIPFKYKVHILALICSIVSIIIVNEGWTMQKLGLRIDNLQISILPYMLFAIVAPIGLFVVARVLNKNKVLQWWKKTHFLFGFIYISFLQEFLFRGFLIPKLQTILSSYFLIILINSLLFAFIHIIYLNNYQSLLIIFIGGIGFATIYTYYPNLILITVLHSILNFVCVLFGFYSKERSLK